MQLAMDFVQTRARRHDCDTSKDAAKHAATGKAARERIAITKAVKASLQGLTAYETAQLLFNTPVFEGIKYDAVYFTVQRRISECGLHKTNMRRDGFAVWRA